MHNFLIIFLITYLAVVYSFGEGNDLMVDDQITPQSTFLQTRFSNGNYAIISGTYGSHTSHSNRFYYYLYDSNCNKLLNGRILTSLITWKKHLLHKKIF